VRSGEGPAAAQLWLQHGGEQQPDSADAQLAFSHDNQDRDTSRSDEGRQQREPKSMRLANTGDAVDSSSIAILTDAPPLLLVVC